MALSGAPAIDVELSLDPPTRLLEGRYEGRFPLRIPVVNAQLPFQLDLEIMFLGRKDLPQTVVHLRYTDVAGQVYEERLDMDVARQLGPVQVGNAEVERIERQLEKIEAAIQGLGGAVGKNERHLDAIARKMK